MKKFTALLLALMLVAGLFACGSQEVPFIPDGAIVPTETDAPEATEAPTTPQVEVEDMLSESGSYSSYTYSNHEINDKGQVISRKVSGDSNRTDVFEYDDQGRVVKCTRTSHYGEEIWTYTYDENGLLVEEFQGDRTFINTYELDDQGRVVKKTSKNKDADYTMVYTYTYNEDGTVATETQTSPNSTYVLTFTYDENGRVLTQTAVKEGESRGSTTRYTYGVVGSYTPAN